MLSSEAKDPGHAFAAHACDPRGGIAMVFETDSPFVAGRCRSTAGQSPGGLL